MRSLTAVLAAALVILPATPAWAANQAPVAVDDAVAYRNSGGIDYVVPALANDSDPDGDPLTYTAVTAATKGNAYLRDGKLFYKPYLGNDGTDSFTYTVTDGHGNTATATVTATLWVTPDLPADVAISSTAPGSVTLTWSAASRAAEYRVYRNRQLVASTPDLTWTDAGLLDTSSYEYQIASVNGGGYEAYWYYAPAAYRQAQLPRPTAVAVDVTDDPTTLSVTWSGGGKLGPWNVYRDGALLASSPNPAFEDTGLVTGREYSYQVQHAFPSTSTVVYLPSPLSAAVRGTPSVLSDIGTLVYWWGGRNSDLGPVTVPERTVPGGRQQDHRNGVIVQQDGKSPITVMRDYATTYAAIGGVFGDLGFPLEYRGGCGTLRDSGCFQVFEGGSIWSSSYTPTTVVWQVIEDGWAASGWEDGPLGYPVDDLVELPGGVWQEFEDGGVYWSEATGPRGVSGETHDAYTARGGATGFLGYPTTDETCGLRADGCVQRFQGGSVYWSPTTGAHPVAGAIGTTWSRHGAVDGGLGYPTTGEICGLRGGGCGQAFQGGSIHWSPATGAQVTTGAIRGAWARSGWENGGLAYPTTGEKCGLRGGGCAQAFQGGSIHWSPATGAQVTTGDILYAWGRQGWENGRLGYPVSGATFSGGAVRQTFQGGTITVPDSTRVARITYR